MKPTQLNTSVFDELASATGSHLISLFLPTHRRGREDVAQDRIRLKNQLAEADDTLSDMGLKPRQRSERLEKAQGLLDDLEFLEHQDDGLAIYIDDRAKVVPVSTTRPLETNSVVMPVFMLRPLAAELNRTVLPVLALTGDEVALFAASEFGVDEIPAELPSYDDVNWFVDREKQRQRHPDIAGSNRSRHGHEPAAKRDADVARFLREIDAAIAGLGEQAPLVVLGEDNLTASFADVSDRETLSPRHSGIKAPISSHEIADRVGTLIAEVGRQRIDAATKKANEQLGLGLGTFEIETALPAAAAGRVDTVVFDRNAAPIWGRFDQLSLEVETHTHQRPGDVELLDRLVVWARQDGASIVSTDGTIDQWTFIATFRY